MNSLSTIRTRRRGVAMALVLVALAVGTVLAAATLASRDSSPLIGANARDFAAANWSAQAGADLGVAILQSDVNWLEISDGELVSSYAIAGGEVTVTITNLDGNPPTEEDNELLLTVTSVVNGIASTTQKRVSITPPVALQEIISPYLDEFAIFATESLELEDNAQVRVAPAVSSSPHPVKIGTGFNSTGSIDIRSDANLINVALYNDANASAGLKSWGQGSPKYAARQVIPLPVPARCAGLPTAFNSLPLRNGGEDIVVSGASKDSHVDELTLTEDGLYANVRVSNDGVLRLNESAGRYYRFESLQVESGGKISVQGEVVIYVAGDCGFLNGAQVFGVDAASGARILTGRNLRIEDSVIGAPASAFSALRSANDVTTLGHTARFRILSLEPSKGGLATPTYDIRENSAIVGCIHAPNAAVELRDNSFITGRVTARTLRVRAGSGVYFDPALDSRAGFSTLDGPLYVEGDPLPNVVSTINSYVTGEGCESLFVRLLNVIRTELTTAVALDVELIPQDETTEEVIDVDKSVISDGTGDSGGSSQPVSASATCGGCKLNVIGGVVWVLKKLHIKPKWSGS